MFKVHAGHLTFYRYPGQSFNMIQSNTEIDQTFTIMFLMSLSHYEHLYSQIYISLYQTTLLVYMIHKYNKWQQNEG